METENKPQTPPGGISPEKLLGCDIHSVVDRMRVLNLKHRVVRKNGLITADYDPMRYTLMVDENNTIIAADLG